ncbi:MAG: type II toxin-antitoxin system PemK/MazF family toxin [Deltaproteobacteria bacterium]|nr:MAG: type II toxin-antitoxin system PemK/MazF family toxin [Deltaproteobacteria bacterium]
MIVKQGDLFWVDFGAARGSGPAYRHPCVVIQNNVFNQSKIQTVIVCALTSNMARSQSPGNVLLSKREANLTKPSIVNVTQVMTVDKSDLTEKIGTLSPKRTKEILEGIDLVLSPRELEGN